MIVVDTNIIAYLYLPTDLTTRVEHLLETEPDWAAPALWRSEFRNVLALYMRKGLLTFENAARIQLEAESLLQGNEYLSNSLDVLKLVQDSSCSAYDCEFVAIAKSLDTKLVTMDKKILKDFSGTAVRLEDIVS